MRNPLGLMLASVVAAVVIAGVWFWTSSPRADAAPQTVAARKAEPLPAPAAKTAARDDVEVTAALSKPAPPVPAPAPDGAVPEFPLAHQAPAPDHQPPQGGFSSSGGQP